jgi:hypothetical protein
MYKHVHTRLNDVRTRLYHYLYVPCTYHVHTCIYIYRNVHTCMYMFMFFNNCIYHVCQPLYTSMVHTLYIHGSDMSVHVYARWSGFQMFATFCCRWLGNHSFHRCQLKDLCARAFWASLLLQTLPLLKNLFLGIIACGRKKCIAHRIFHGVWLGNHPFYLWQLKDLCARAL